MLLLRCQQCSRQQELADWLPFGYHDEYRHAFCSEECRKKWWDRMRAVPRRTIAEPGREKGERDVQ